MLEAAVLAELLYAGIGGEGGGGNGINGVPSIQGKGQDGDPNTGGGSGGGTNYQHSGVAQASGGFRCCYF